MIRGENSFRWVTESNASKFCRKSYFQPRILYLAKNPVKCVGRNKDILKLVKSKILTLCILESNKDALHRKRGSKLKKGKVEVQETGNATPKERRNHIDKNKARSEDTVCAPGIKAYQSTYQSTLQEVITLPKKKEDEFIRIPHMNEIRNLENNLKLSYW